MRVGSLLELASTSWLVNFAPLPPCIWANLWSFYFWVWEQNFFYLMAQPCNFFCIFYMYDQYLTCVTHFFKRFRLIKNQFNSKLNKQYGFFYQRYFTWIKTKCTIHFGITLYIYVVYMYIVCHIQCISYFYFLFLFLISIPKENKFTKKDAV